MGDLRVVFERIEQEAVVFIEEACLYPTKK